ncbi:Heat shock protein 91 isoform 2 [Hibiscus syriacus]|uniref:Heat shock protein 91 isoform 2 n=1 Tax=Hibiscus syriacus TaxID=106335 RepID=A0A6A2XSQ7_HIBSY|nr:Heat shock protein 91 isoform 2 [Hibiscus syriacus]
MSKKLQKSLQDYLSKIKSTSPNIQFPSKSVSSSKKWILKGCRHPRTLSFAVTPTRNHVHQGTNDDNNDDAATLADVDRFLFENFRSLYIEEDDEVNEKRCLQVRSEEDHEGDHHLVRSSGRCISKRMTVNEKRCLQVRSEEDHEGDHHLVRSSGGFLLHSPRFMDRPSYLFGPNRFFVSTGSSNSLVGKAGSNAGTNTTMSISENMGSTSTSSASTNNATASDDCNSNVGVEGDGVTGRNECIAVLTYSPSPYDDFRRSMQEIVEARLKHHSEIDWDFMEELVFCYLNLNDNKSHKFILSAFVDLVVDLRQKDMKIPVNTRHFKANNVQDHSKSRRTRRHVSSLNLVAALHLRHVSVIPRHHATLISFAKDPEAFFSSAPPSPSSAAVFFIHLYISQIHLRFSQSSCIETDVNMQYVKGIVDLAGVENGAHESGDKPMQTETDSKVEAPKKVKKTNVPVAELVYGAMLPADVQKAVEEFEMTLQDRVMEETKDKKNAIEAYVYDMRNKKEEFAAKLQETEDCLYEDGEDETKGVYVAKLEELNKGILLKSVTKNMLRRGTVLDQLTYCINSYREAAMSTELRKNDEALDRFCRPIMTKAKLVQPATPETPPATPSQGSEAQPQGADGTEANRNMNPCESTAASNGEAPPTSAEPMETDKSETTSSAA